MTAVLMERVALAAAPGEVARVASHYQSRRRRPGRPVAACQVSLARPRQSVSANWLWLRAARAGFGMVYLGGLAVLVWTVIDRLTPVYQLMPLG